VNMFVFLDEREDSINDGWFASDPDTQYSVVDWPASYHNGAAGYSFADGHSEVHRWRDGRTMPGLNQGLIGTKALSGDADVLWMAQKAAGVSSYP
jgi:prepilin-type processing-associated H-X9-DG protein